MPPKFNGILFALAAYGLFASHDAVVKALGATYATFQIVFFSVLLSMPLLLLMLMRDETKGTLIPVHPWWSALRTASAVIAAASAFYAFTVLPLAEAYALIFAMPMIITILSIPVLGERVGGHRWFAIIVGLAGVLVVLQPGSSDFTLGHAAALTVAVFGSLASVIVRKIGQDERSAVLLLYPMMANFIIMGAILPFVYRPIAGSDLGLIAIMSVLAFVAGLCLIAAYKRADAAIVAPMQYSQIIWAALFGLVFFSETASQTTWIGAAIVISSGIYIVVREAIGGTSQKTPVSRGRLRPETGTSPRLGALWWKHDQPGK